MERAYDPIGYEPEDYDVEEAPAPVVEPEPVRPSSTEPATVTPTPAEPRPVESEASKPAAPRAPGKYVPIGYEPGPAEDPIGSGTAFTRSLIGSTIETKRMLANAYEGFQLLRDPNYEVDYSPDAVTGYERKVPSLTNVKDISTGLTWLGETLGSALPQWAPTIAGSTIGTAGGALTAPVTGPGGAIVGGATGGLTASIIQNYGDVWGGFKQDAGIKALLDNKQTDAATLAKYALAASTVIGTLDAVSLGKITGKFGLPKDLSPTQLATEVAKRWTIAAITKRAGKGFATESFTEAAQSLIAQATEVGIGGNWDITNRVIRLFDEFAGGGVQGATVGAVSAPRSPEAPNTGEEAPVKEDDQPGVAAPVLPEGTPAPAEAAPAAEVSTPGDLTSKTPAPAAGTDKQPAEANPAQPKIPESTTVTEVAPGQQAPEIAAALPGTPAVTAPAAAAAAGPAAAAPTPMADEGITEGAIPTEEEDAAQSAFMQKLLAQTQPNQDVTAALNETLGQPAPQPTAQAPVIPTPEPPGTIEAKQRREGTAPATLGAPALPPSEGDTAAAEPTPPTLGTEVTQERAPALPSPAPALAEPTPEVPVEPPVAPAVAAATAAYTPIGYEPEDFTPEDFMDEEVEAGPGEPAERDQLAEALTEPTRKETAPAAVPVAKAPKPAEIEGRKPVTVKGVTAEEAKEKFARKVPLKKGQPKAEIVKPSPTEQAPEKAEPKFTKAQRELHGEVLQKIPADLETHRHAQAAIEEAVREDKSPVRPRKPAEQQAQVEKTLEAARRHAKRLLDEEVAAVGSQAEQELARAKDVARERETKGKPQERKRRGKSKGKAAEDVAIQGDKGWAKDVDREREKPFSEQDKDLIQYGDLRDKRNALAPKDKQRKTYNELMKEAQARHVETLRKDEEARKPPEAPTTTVVPEAELTEAEKEAVVAAQHKEAEKKRAETAATRRTIVAPIVKPLVDAAVIPDEFHQPEGSKVAFRKSPALFDRQLRDLMKSFHGAVLRAMKDAKLELGKKFGEYQSPEEHLAIFADKILHGDLADEFSGMEGSAFATALTLYKAGDYADLYEHVSGDTRGESGATDYVEPRHKRQHGAIPIEDESNTFQVGQDPARKETQASRGEARGRDQFANEPIIIKSRRFGSSFQATPLQTMTGAQALARITTAHYPAWTKGPLTWIRKMHTKALRQMVGGVPVHIVTQDEITRATGGVPAGGLYMPGGTTAGSPGQRAAGKVQPAILISAEVAADPYYFATVVIHEMTHAATSYALYGNLRGTAQILEDLMDSLKIQLKADGVWDRIPEEGKYGFTNPSEFLAEAFSNPQFQELLSRYAVPTSMRGRIGMIHTAGPRAPTWWQWFAATVSNALGIHVRLGTSYMEQMLALHPASMMSSAAQQADLEARYGTGFRLFSKKQATQPNEMNVLDPRIHERVTQQFDAARQAAEDRWYNTNARGVKALLATTYELMRRSDRLFGLGAANKFRPVARLLLAARNARDKLADAGRKLVKNQLTLKLRDFKEYEAFSDNVHEATLLGMDPRLTLAENVAAGNVTKGGDLDAYKRDAFPDLKTAYDKLKPGTKQIYDDTVKHHNWQETTRRTELTRNALRSLVRHYNLTLPTSMDDTVNDIMSGLLDTDPATMTDPVQQAKAVALRKALGTHADSLAGIPAMRKIKGVYVPLMRWGKFVITASQDIVAPPGGTIDPKNANQILFTDMADYRAYAKSQRDQIDRVTSEWWDPVTGQRSTKKGSVAHQPGVVTTTRQIIRVTVMNRLVEMDDNESALVRRREELQKAGFKVTQVVMTDKEMERSGDLMPAQITRLMNAIDTTTTAGTNIGKQAVQHGLMDAYIRTLMGSRAQHRRLKRQGIQGFNRDLVTATNNANHIMAGHIANLQLAPKLNDAQADLDNFMKTEERNDFGKTNRTTLERQAMVKELDKRILAMQTRNEDHYGQHALRNMLDLSFLTHLASPAYTIINLMQTAVTTMPILGAKFGVFAAGRQMARASKDLGVHRTVVRGAGRRCAKSATPFEEYRSISTTITLTPWRRSPALSRTPSAPAT